MRHETGHTLNTAAFGTAFGVMTWIDQNIFGNRHEAYGEMIAESIHSRGKPTISMWS